MHRLVFSLLLLSMLSACGRSSSDVYRAYNSTYNRTDLAAQNRQSFQDGSHSGYLYTNPQTTALNPGEIDSDTVLETDSLVPDTLRQPKTETSSADRPTQMNKPSLAPATSTAQPVSQPAPVYRQAPAFELEDLQGKKRSFSYPLARPTVMAFADQKGAEQMEAWIKPLYARYGDKIEIHGVAELSAVPGFARGIARGIIGGLVEQPIMLDWTGKVSKQFGMQPKITNIYLLNTQGQILAEGAGLADLEKLTVFVKALDPLLTP